MVGYEGVEWGTKEAMGDSHGMGERGFANVDWKEVGQRLVIDNDIVKCCLIAATLEGLIQEAGAFIKDMEVVIGSKLDKGIALLFCLLACSGGEGNSCVLITQALGGKTMVDMGVEVTHNQERSTW